MEPLPLAAFETHRLPRDGGDLARMLAQEQAIAEPNYLVLVPRPPLKTLTAKTDISILPKVWPPDEGPTYINNPTQKYKAVVFRDSFTSFLTPFLGYHFKRIVFIWQRPWDYNVLQRERPDVVIDETLERYLGVPLVDLPENTHDEKHSMGLLGKATNSR